MKELLQRGRIVLVMAGRSPDRIVLSEEERSELEHRAACYSRPFREVQRARLVLMAADGLRNVQIGQQLGMAPGRRGAMAKTLSR